MGCKKLFFSVFALLLLVVLFSGLISSSNCWDYDENEATCNSQSDCIYHSESWGSWCEELGCWSLTQTQCANSTFTATFGKNCQWKNPNDWGWCSQTSCWSFERTNESYCENSSANGGLNCEWVSDCRGSNPYTNCWSLTTQAECGNVSGCYWGGCSDLGCWNYNTAVTCTEATGSRGQSCLWNSGSNYCYEPSCWDYGGSTANETWCETTSGLNCTWVDNYYVHSSCEELSCWHYDYTNESQCENATLNGGINCIWDGQYCMMDGCWNYNTQGTCTSASGCSWQTSTGSGWCEETWLCGWIGQGLKRLTGQPRFIWPGSTAIFSRATRTTWALKTYQKPLHGTTRRTRNTT